MYTNTLHEGTKEVIKKLKKVEVTKDFYLSGGTSLALQLGHRESKDLDFFTQKDFEPEKLQTDLDIACTKLITVSSRGGKKDFIDIYFLLQKYNLPFLLKKLDKKYKRVNYNLPAILKSLVYFEDAENQPLPRMHKKMDWKDVKRTIIEKVKNYKV